MVRRWSRLLVEAIDPVLADSPFQSGQTGEPPTDEFPGWTPRPGASVIWCGPYGEVMRAYPHLKRPLGDPAEEYLCFDLTAEIDADGRLSDVLLEHGDLAQAFAEMGRTDEADASAALLGRPAETAVPELAVLLARLFTTADPAAGPSERRR